MNFEFEAHTTYVGKIIDGKVCYIGKFDSFADKWLYGHWYSDDFTESFVFSNDLTCVRNETDHFDKYYYSGMPGDEILWLENADGTQVCYSIVKNSDTEIELALYNMDDWSTGEFITFRK